MMETAEITGSVNRRDCASTATEVSPPESVNRERRAKVPAPSAVAKDKTAQRPRLGCAGIVRCGDAVLLGRRDKEPNRGLWVLPGGRVEFGDSFAKTLVRELLEEAGIDVEVDDFFKVYELINPPDEHRVIVYLTAHHRSGKPIPSSDLSEVGFFRRDELKAMSDQRLISPFVERVLREATLL